MKKTVAINENGVFGLNKLMDLIIYNNNLSGRVKPYLAITVPQKNKT